MESLLTSLTSSASANAKLTSWEVAFRGPLSWELALIFGVLFAGLATFLYVLERAKVGPIRIVALTLLRTGVFALLLLLLMGPIIAVELTDERPRPVILLVGNRQTLQYPVGCRQRDCV